MKKRLSALTSIPSKFSKFEIALSHFLENSSLNKSDSLQELAEHILKIHLEKLAENEAVVLRDLDPEGIHDMRVAARRLRAALRTFKKIFPTKAQKLCPRLQQIGLILGKKRILYLLSIYSQNH